MDVSQPVYAVEDVNWDFDVHFYFGDEILIGSEELEFMVDLPEYATGVINVYLDDDLIESRNLDDEDYDDDFSFDAVGLECGSHNLTVKVESYDFEVVIHLFN